jgi:hypothetical protein
LPPEEPTAENPPNGAILDYFLPVDTSKLVIRIYDAHRKLVQQITSSDGHSANHAALPIAERWFPKPQQLETSPGMHRFVWNLAWGTSGVPESDEPDDGEGDIPRGPRAAPGSYSVELVADGKVLSRELLLVAKDPRSPATQVEFEENFAADYRMFLDSLNCRRALAEIGSVKEQLNKLVSSSNDNAITSKTKQLSAAVDALVEDSDGAQLGLDAANQELTAAMNMAESSDRRVPAQALIVYDEARSASERRIKDWAALKRGPLEALNLELKKQSLKPIAITEIEREIYELMTR